MLYSFRSPHLLFRGATLRLRPQRLEHLWFTQLPRLVPPNGLVIHQPTTEGIPPSRGTLARVRYTDQYQLDGVELLGVARVRVTGHDGSGEPPSLEVALVRDESTSRTTDAARAVKVAALRFLAGKSELEWALEAMVHAEEPGAVADVACQVLFCDSPGRSELLGVSDLTSRLVVCHQLLTQIGRAAPRRTTEPADIPDRGRRAPVMDRPAPPEPAPSFAVRAPRREPEPTAPTHRLAHQDDECSAPPASDGTAGAARGAGPRVPEVRELPPVRRPSQLRNFGAVGGMDKLKRELRRSVGLLVRQPEAVAALDYHFSGVLLHGPPGVGKSYLAEATAGEFGLNFMRVSIGDVLSCWQGEAERHLRAVFAAARDSRPCLLFFDEFDALAAKRGGGGPSETFDRRILDQLLGLLEDTRSNQGVVVMAATNDLRALDPAAIREGRFDRQVFIDMPDRSARRAIFATHLGSRRVEGEIDLDELADRTSGLSAAAIRTIVVGAAGFAIEARELDPAAPVGITAALLDTAIRERRGQDRPLLERRTWDQLILPEGVVAELRRMVRMMVDPDELRRRGLRPLTGALLCGPPGTGKSTIARVIASETDGAVNFYPVSAPDILGANLGTSSTRVRDLFERARQYSPSLIFVDEADALLHRRGGDDSASRERDSVVAEFLAQVDGLASRPGVFVLAATNLPDRVDPAITRSGRLTWRIDVPLPGPSERIALLRFFVKGMRLADDVDLEEVAESCVDRSGADIEAVCSEAGYQTLGRSGDDAVVRRADFVSALERT